MIVRILIGGITGAFVGYFTNWLALRMLFYPKKSILGIQGLLPKYKHIFAEKATEFVFQFIDLEAILRDIAQKREFTSGIDGTNWGFLRKTIGYVVANQIEFLLSEKHIRKYVAKNLKDLTPQARAMLTKRIINTKIDNLITIILKSASREMKFTQLLGGILGFLIGIFPPLLSLLISR